MKTITTTNGYEVLVSDEDFGFLNQWTWYAQLSNSIPVGIHCNLEKPLIMSHEILKHRGINFKREVDHKDRNSLNNQFENLRPASRSQNEINKGLTVANTSGFKGVCYHKKLGKYVAGIKIHGTRIHLGCFCDPTHAAKEYDKAAKHYFGDFAVLNYP